MDGFRAIVSTEGTLRVRSRRGWDMTPHVGFRTRLPSAPFSTVSLSRSTARGSPDFPQLCECALIGGARAGIVGRLDALEAPMEQTAETEAGQTVTSSL